MYRDREGNKRIFLKLLFSEWGNPDKKNAKITYPSILTLHSVECLHLQEKEEYEIQNIFVILDYS